MARKAFSRAWMARRRVACAWSAETGDGALDKGGKEGESVRGRRSAETGSDPGMS